MEKQLTELRALAAKAENRRTETGIPRVAMVQGEIPEHQLAAVYDPMVNLILTGSKTMTVGDRTFHYDPATYFVMSVDLPAVGSVHPSSAGEPYLAVSLTLDPTIVAGLIHDLPVEVSSELFGSGFSVAPINEDFLDAWIRMLRLMERPDEIAALSPAYEREILFRVLQGPLGWMLRDIASPDTALSRISVAINWIRQNFAETIRVEALAEMAALSVSACHRHFKAVTALSPLQYQKRVRLLHARSLLIAGQGNATSISFGVGYESPNQFSREYARLFGLPPSKDLARATQVPRAA
ncbi:AraC family transcriptional regulator [Agrobacterium rubi]|uniref:AraC family transcriptional regulator n=1 Tax=Agrobacterium rubi TaxID=28099 RepID=A0AAE7RAX6_9HYPH|nr:AraC family transcriptional regulator [Agrobacterium rubi]NTE89891.1 AraC family transcriptional regulator [Agrobacterium rubi]NTF05732.1 AraC family transcriptional regulator [Agrobacterium rubi]NTF40023.1 AraC family transcriptional regulator [Agrobacterium rubi]OCJ50934.1 AraC family transcriptional regulator [Agrobacterium rubi]QTG03077.1 AraC family transcriptional regulator [Agrobacterium rubi]